MGIVSRLSTVLRANLNALADKGEDPAKRIEQTIRDMQAELKRARRDLITTMGTAKRLEQKRAALDEDAERWEARAVVALREGDETLAREALRQKRRVKTEAEQVFAHKSHTFTLASDPDLYVRGSMSELYSALSNILFNAAKYTPDKGEIGLSAHLNSAGLDVEVTDNGVGIAEHHIPRLTERFYRVDESRSTDTGGTGLGLAIVKHVLARHGGSLEIYSKVGKGSRFVCHFPKERLLPAPVQAVKSA